eukprot:SAG31_NODE_27511_length_425_cov_0.625767_2_plen_66_part_01
MTTDCGPMVSPFNRKCSPIQGHEFRLTLHCTEGVGASRAAREAFIKAKYQKKDFIQRESTAGSNPT